METLIVYLHFLFQNTPLRVAAILAIRSGVAALDLELLESPPYKEIGVAGVARVTAI